MRSATRERILIPSLIGIAFTVSVIQSLGAPLVPTIADEFHVSLGAAQWSLTITLLAGAVVSPVVGRLGDGAHRRRVMLICLAAVTVGGALAAVARSLPVLLAGRALQGFGLALIPLTMASARDELTPRRVAGTIAALSVIGPIGSGLGYPVTGLIAQQFGIHAAFWFGTVASAASFAVAAIVVPDGRVAPNRGSLDIVGAALIGLGLVALLIAMEQGPIWGWGSERTLGLIAAAVVLMELWRRNELAVNAPLIDVRLVRSRAALTANVTAFVLSVSIYLCMSLMTQFVQIPAGFDRSVFIAGLILVPMSVVSAVSTRMIGALRRRVGARALVPLGTATTAAGMLFFAAAHGALWEAFVMMGILGLGLAIAFAALPTLIIASVPNNETSSAMSFYQVVRYVGFALGTGLAITLLRVFHPSGPPTASTYASSLAVGGIICLLSGVVNWVMLRPGHETPAPTATSPLVNDQALEEAELSAGLPGVGD